MPIPPGGYQGFAQMTPASQLALTRGTRGSSTRRKRRARKVKAHSRRKNGKRKLKFGSPAWRKKYMKKRR